MSNMFEFIYKKSIYQCKSGHLACEECWRTSLNCKQECMAFRNTARDIGVKFKRKLEKDEENGCKEELVVKELESCLKNCEFRFALCSNEGCKEILIFNSLGEHEKQCTFKLETCEYCKRNDIKMSELENHHKECPKVTIDCLQGCLIKMERDHIDNDCNNSIVHCKYSKYGCKVQTKRSELENHLENINHQKFMGALIKQLTTYIEQSNKIQNEYQQELLKKSILASKEEQTVLSKGIIRNDNRFGKLMEYQNKWIFKLLYQGQ
ncbi:hypothetical protein ACTA71_000140 [Dictyostelium dimigraforme]